MQSIYLDGTEDVRRAASTMSSAAREMLNAASNIDDALLRHRLFLDDWLFRFEQIMERVAQPPPGGKG